MEEQNNSAPEQSLMDHLTELRDRLMWIVLVILVAFLILFAFSEQLFSFAAEPLLAQMPEGTNIFPRDQFALNISLYNSFVEKQITFDHTRKHAPLITIVLLLLSNLKTIVKPLSLYGNIQQPTYVCHIRQSHGMVIRVFAKEDP